MKNIEAGRRMVARNVFGNLFDVQTDVGSNSTRIVDLVARTCSCKMFQDLVIRVPMPALPLSSPKSTSWLYASTRDESGL